ALSQRAALRSVQRPASSLPTPLKEPTARRAVEKLFRGAINMVMHPRHPDGCLLVHGALAVSPACASIRTQLSLRRTAAEAAVRGRFEQAIADGDLPANVNARTLARYIVTVLWGLSVQAGGGAKRSELRHVARLPLQCWPRQSPTKR